MATPDLDAFRAKRETHRISGIMRNGERFHRDIPDLEAVPGFEAFEFFQLGRLAIRIAHGADHA